MAEKPTARVLIEARDLDTDERDEVIVPAHRPTAEAGRKRELRELIAKEHPDATFRSFARDAASALGPQHLIVAHYIGEAAPETVRTQVEVKADQGELFAA